MPAEHFRYDDLHYRVSAADGSHLAWLRDFLLPHFEAGAGPDAPIEVRFETDPGAHGRWLAAPPAGVEVTAFAADSEILRLTLRTSPAGATLLWSEGHRVLYDVSPDRRAVRIIAGGAPIVARTDLMRVVREYAMNRAQARGDFFLHASCFQGGGRPVVVTAPKNAGKTTLLMFAGIGGGARILANDRVRVTRTSEGYLLRGIPTIVSVRAGSLGFFPAAGRRITAEGLNYRVGGDERLEEACPGAPLLRRERYALSPAQFAHLLGTSQVAVASNPVVVVPRLTGRPGLFTLRRIPAEESVNLVRDTLFGSGHGVSSTAVFTLHPAGHGAGREELERRCRAFLSAVPCFACELGTDIYGRPEHALTWMEAIDEAAGTDL